MRCLRLFVLPKSQIQTHTHILISHRSVHSDTRRKSEERRRRRARGNGWAPPFTASTIISLLDPLPLFILLSSLFKQTFITQKAWHCRQDEETPRPLHLNTAANGDRHGDRRQEKCAEAMHDEFSPRAVCDGHA